MKRYRYLTSPKEVIDCFLTENFRHLRFYLDSAKKLWQIVPGSRIDPSEARTDVNIIFFPIVRLVCPPAGYGITVVTGPRCQMRFVLCVSQYNKYKIIWKQLHYNVSWKFISRTDMDPPPFPGHAWGHFIDLVDYNLSHFRHTFLSHTKKVCLWYHLVWVTFQFWPISTKLYTNIEPLVTTQPPHNFSQLPIIAINNMENANLWGASLYKVLKLYIVIYY